MKIIITAIAIALATITIAKALGTNTQEVNTQETITQEFKAHCFKAKELEIEARAIRNSLFSSLGSGILKTEYILNPELKIKLETELEILRAQAGEHNRRCREG